MMVYREWDVDNDLVTEYERRGEGLRCGECCRHRLELAYSKHDGAYHLGIHGTWHEVSGKGHLFYAQVTGVDPKRTFGEWSPCSRLTEDNLCGIGGRPRGDRQICDLWPLAPRCLECFPDCGYSFTKIREEAISGAHPSTWEALLDEWEKEKVTVQ